MVFRGLGSKIYRVRSEKGIVAQGEGDVEMCPYQNIIKDKEDIEGFGQSKYVWRAYWSPSARNREDTLLKVLISMTGNTFIPNWFLSLLRRSKLLLKKPGLLARFVLNPSFERFQTLSQSIYYLHRFFLI